MSVEQSITNDCSGRHYSRGRLFFRFTPTAQRRRSVKEESLQQHTNAISATARCSSRDGFLLTRALARRFHCITPQCIMGDLYSYTKCQRCAHSTETPTLVSVVRPGSQQHPAASSILQRTSATDPHDSQMAAQPVTPSSPAESSRSLDTAH
ncbi:unnamed protein product [Arctogadus glacialis]